MKNKKRKFIPKWRGIGKVKKAVWGWGPKAKRQSHGVRGVGVSLRKPDLLRKGEKQCGGKKKEGSMMGIR